MGRKSLIQNPEAINQILRMFCLRMHIVHNNALHIRLAQKKCFYCISIKYCCRKLRIKEIQLLNYVFMTKGLEYLFFFRGKLI